MYEHMTFETILQRMLDAVPGGFDTREGSVIYDALAPSAAELAQMYITLEDVLNLAFAESSRGEHLEKRTMEMGISRRPATKAKKKGAFYGVDNMPFEVPLGARFSAEDLNYVVLEKLADGEYALECETTGKDGDRPQGRLIPIDYIPGLVRAELTELLVHGVDTESDESLLQRYQLRVRQPTTSGNIYHYKQWALDVEGVGDAKVFPLWNGAGTVKVVIVDSEKQPASPYLVQEVANYIEEVRPIGALVTVVSGEAKLINVSATLKTSNSYTLQDINDNFRNQLNNYFKEAAFAITEVSYSKVGSILLSTPGVLDYSNLVLNNTTGNIQLAAEEIPVVGELDLGV